MEVGWTISSLGLAVSPVLRSEAVNVWRKADTGITTDEAQIGHRGLHGDPSIVNTASQSIHRKASLMFMISSVYPFDVALSTLLRQFS